MACCKVLEGSWLGRYYLLFELVLSLCLSLSFAYLNWGLGRALKARGPARNVWKRLADAVDEKLELFLVVCLSIWDTNIRGAFHKPEYGMPLGRRRSPL